jgi:ATP-dependent Clp protease protease subunit
MQGDIALIETTEKFGQFANAKPVYLQNPLREDGTLVISDRRISLNGMISSTTADYITSRIEYWNNKDRKLPIFIVIDDCPGGSVMAGYRILKAMDASDAPIHVVVKSFAASMAACITTLAKESYAYPNSVILHHQISSQIVGARLNLTQQREFFEESTRWWQRLATPVATKMGITTDEFIKRMYAQTTSGDWSEFGDKACELKWVNHIVTGVEESSFTKDPDAKPTPPTAPVPATRTALVEEVDQDGRPFAWLPRLNPKDVYFLYNPDGYYRVR